MTGWLLDTNIVSQFAPEKDGKPKIAADLSDWVRHNANALFLSALSVVEITAGIGKLRRAGAERRAADLDTWLDRIIALYGERVLPLDAEVGKVAGVLADQARANGRHPGLSDVLIAATAQAHGLGLLTDNIRHFRRLNLNIRLLNPLHDTLPDAE